MQGLKVTLSVIAFATGLSDLALAQASPDKCEIARGLKITAKQLGCAREADCQN